MSDYHLQAIGTAKTPFSEKFGIPRQALLVEGLEGEIHLLPPFHQAEACRGLQDYSHLWVLWLFHKNLHSGWKPTVRPPRFGGNQRVGVFATRSSFRPNGIGQSVVKLLGIQHEKERSILHIQGPDFLDGTPIIDIKPYLTYADAIRDARSIAEKPAQKLTVSWATKADLPNKDRGVIEQLIALDPRPAYQDDPKKTYRMRFAEWDIHWQVAHDCATITRVQNAT